MLTLCKAATIDVHVSGMFGALLRFSVANLPQVVATVVAGTTQLGVMSWYVRFIRPGLHVLTSLLRRMFTNIP